MVNKTDELLAVMKVIVYLGEERKREGINKWADISKEKTSYSDKDLL